MISCLILFCSSAFCEELAQIILTIDKTPCYLFKQEVGTQECSEQEANNKIICSICEELVDNKEKFEKILKSYGITVYCDQFIFKEVVK
jgi:hypothetical protein